ncbi:hypothetical protein BDV98DRAFT_528221 [Pterulicium gracile]|uniref:RhoGAP-domain-containing protein n=1 Tax=Pterulicium gracile TaxID=1884261 RepID=A0A5C3QKI1_9AGAR|nr:hypothetical protein BDV98DRAFT_528221 [Pterula gracilis]
MLAAQSVAASRSQVPLREHSHLDLHGADSQSSVGMEDTLCPGCKKSAVNENGGLVVAFGQSFFHVDCFKCAKCGDQVTADTNLLLLSDGSPICANCSYSCNVCGEPILDEAIMTGDDSYHAYCFKCKVCKNRIDDLVFAKTKQGIYCMNCHNDRMIKVRKHAQKKAERERAGAAASGSSRTRDTQARDYHRDANSEGRNLDEFGARSHQPPAPYGDEFTSSTSNSRPRTKPPPLIRSTSSQPSPPPSRNAGQPPQTSFSPHPASPPPVGSSADRRPPQAGRSMSERQHQQHTVPIIHQSPSTSAFPSPPNSDLSYQSSQLSQSSSLQPPFSTSGSLSPGTTSRAAKRGSINPGLALAPNFLEQLANGGGSSGVGVGQPSGNGGRASPTISPRSASSPSPPTSGGGITGRDSPRGAPSPLRENFPSRPSYDSGSRPGSARKPGDGSGWPNHLQSEQGSGTRLRTVSVDTYALERDAASGYSSSSGTMMPHQQHLQKHGVSTSASATNLRGHGSFEKSRPGSGSSVNGYGYPKGEERRGASDVSTSSGYGNDSEAGNTTLKGDERPPALPPKDAQGRPTRSGSTPLSQSSQSQLRNRPRPPSLQSPGSSSGQAAADTTSDLDLDDLGESPVEQVSRTTYIAPALPPIRLSLNPDEFTSLLQAVGGLPPLKALEMLAEAAEAENGPGNGTWGKSSPAADSVPQTPPPTAKTLLDPSADGAKTPTAAVLNKPSGVPRPASPESGVASGRASPSSLAYADNATIINGYGGLQASSNRSSAHHDEGEMESMPSYSDTLVSGSRSSLASDSMGSMAASGESVQSETDTLAGSRGKDGVQGRAWLQNHSHIHHQKQFSVGSNISMVDVGEEEEEESLRDGPNGYSHTNEYPGTPTARITVAEPGSDVGKALPPTMPMPDTNELVMRRLREALADANERGNQQLKLDRGFLEAIVRQLEARSAQVAEMKGSLDGFRRASQSYQDGVAVAQVEFDAEVRARRDAEAEVKRLRVLLSEQAARLTMLSGETRRLEAKRISEKTIHDNLAGLEQEMSRLKVQRDLTIAEVEELTATKGTPNAEPVGGQDQKLSRSLTTRLDKLKQQYHSELTPLKQQRDILVRELSELKTIRDTFLEETTVLSERNEALAQLNTVYARRVESLPDAHKQQQHQQSHRPLQEKPSTSFDKTRTQQHSLYQSNPSVTNLDHDGSNGGFLKAPRADAVDLTPSKSKFKWPGSRQRDASNPGGTNPVNISTPVAIPPAQMQMPVPVPAMPEKVASHGQSGTPTMGHTFQQVSVLRFTRCDHCGEKLWGSQLKCSVCNISIHVRCCNHVSPSCQKPTIAREDPGVMPPSMFGRDLIEQVHADANGGDRTIPVIVEKCIDAVEALALDYEGIYRKTGGSGQSRMITGLFERGDYDSINLLDTDRFNDICSVTSVLKNYFRSLPVPLLTFDLHEQFMTAVELRDPALKSKTMSELVEAMPKEHYDTVKMLMLHLNHVCQQSEVNLMNGRNLGLVFGPTLMRSKDPAAEYGDMAGKALSVEWLIENAPTLFGT